MKTPETLTTEARRRALLVALNVATQFSLLPRALRAQLDAIGHAVSLDRLYTECAWLAEQGLVTIYPEGPVRLTDRGADVVQGTSVVPGVARPEPGELQ